MHLLFCTHDFDCGGSARSLSILIRELASRHTITILSFQTPSPQKGMLAVYRELGVRIVVCPWGWLPVSYIGCHISPADHKQLSASMREDVPTLKALMAEADIVCFNGYASSSLASLVPSRIPRYLIAREVVDENSPELVNTMTFLRRNITMAAAIGPVEAEQLTRWNIPNITVFNSSVHPPQFREFAPIPPLHFGVFGQLVPSKGQHLLAYACTGAANFLRKNNAVVHIFGGTGFPAMSPLEEPIMQLIAEQHMEDVLVMEGWVDDVEARMAAMHCIVRPDRTGSPWGRDVIEAMSMGRPVLATGTQSVFVKPGETGWLVPPDDPYELAVALTKLAENPAQIIKMASRAFHFAQQNFNPCRNSEQLEAMFAGQLTSSAVQSVKNMPNTEQ